MSLLLKLLIVYIFFAFFIIGFLLSKIKFKIKNWDFETNLKNVHKDFEVDIGIYLYGYIKIIGASLKDDGVRIWGKKVDYDKFKKYEPFRNVNFKSIDRDFKISELREWKLQLEKLNLTLDVGFENVLFTSFSVFLISTILSIFVKKTVKKYNPKKYEYMIMPHYRSTNQIKLKANGIISAKTVHIIFILLKYKKRRAKNYERTSYRRSYENSYEQH